MPGAQSQVHAVGEFFELEAGQDLLDDEGLALASSEDPSGLAFFLRFPRCPFFRLSLYDRVQDRRGKLRSAFFRLRVFVVLFHEDGEIGMSERFAPKFLPQQINQILRGGSFPFFLVPPFG